MHIFSHLTLVHLKVASNANDEAGDGTTTSSLLAYAICAEGCKSVRRGVGAVDVKRGIDLAVQKVVDHLHSQTRNVTSKEDVVSGVSSVQN